jgi:hypothetical protein
MAKSFGSPQLRVIVGNEDTQNQGLSHLNDSFSQRVVESQSLPLFDVNHWQEDTCDRHFGKSGLSYSSPKP